MKYFKFFERCELCTAISLHHGRISTSVTQFLFKVPEVSIWHLAMRCTYKNLLLYYAYVRLNMFRAPLCPSSGAHDESDGYHIGRLVL